MEELLSLKWNNHRSTFLHILGVLRDKQSYTDVTLACDGKFYSVHKLVLSTCSDYFCAMFEKTACKSPVIVLKDIKSEDLEALLDYMYLGEVNVRQSDLASLIKAAENLRIKGLAVPDDEPSKKSVVGAPSRREGSPPAKRKRRDESDDGRDAIRPLPSSLPNPPPSRPRSPVIERLSPSPHRTTQDPSLVEDHGRPHSSPAEPSVSSHSSSQPSQSQPGGGNQFQSEDAPFVKVEMEDDEPEPDGTEYTVNSDGYKEEDGDSGGGDLPEFLQAAASGTLSSSTSSYSHPSFAGPSSYQPGDMAGWQGDVSNLGFPSHLNFSTSDTSSQQNAPGEVVVVPGEGCSGSQGSILVCPVCGKTAHGRNRRQNMDNHILTHTGERPFQCTICSYRASQIGNLKRHERAVHREVAVKDIQFNPSASAVHYLDVGSSLSHSNQIPQTVASSSSSSHTTPLSHSHLNFDEGLAANFGNSMVSKVTHNRRDSEPPFGLHLRLKSDNAPNESRPGTNAE